MSVSVSMPQLGESVTEGTVTRWLKKEGERVAAGEPYPPGTATGPAGEGFPGLGTPPTGPPPDLGGPAGPRPVTVPQARPEPSVPPSPAQPATPVPALAPPGLTGADSPYVTPLVRKLAAEHGVDLASLAGTGVGGRIRKQDVLDAAAKAKEAAAKPAPAA